MQNAAKGLRERLAGGTEDRLGKAITDLFDNPLLNGALGRASDAREKAAQAQELAMGALNLPSAADIERLTRRLRSVSQRLEGIEDGVHRIGRTLSGPSIETRLGGDRGAAAELSGKLDAGRCGHRHLGRSRCPIGARRHKRLPPNGPLPNARVSDAKPGLPQSATAPSARRLKRLNQRADRHPAHRLGCRQQRVVVDVLLLRRRGPRRPRSRR